MNVFALFSLLSAVICFFLGTYIYSKDSRNLLNIVFTIFCLFGAYAAFTEFGYRQAESFEAAYFWLKMSVLWPFVIVLLLHFVLVFTEHANLLKNKVTYMFLYGPAIFFILGLILILPRPVKTYWGWTFGTLESTLFLNIFVMWLVGLTILSLYLCARYYLIVSDNKKKQQAKYASIGALFPVVMGLFTNWLLPTLSMRIPELVTLSFALGCIFIGYAIVKHDLFILTPATAAESIITTMSDSLLLLSPDRKILSVNQATLTLLGYEEKELIDQPVEIIFTKEVENTIFKGKEIDKLITTNNISDVETTFETKDGRTIPVSLSASIMRDNIGDLRGIVFIGRNITERKKLETLLKDYNENLEKLVEERSSELKESKERYHGLYESSIDGIASATINGRIIECNQAFADMLGYTKEELKKMGFWEFIYSKWHDTIQNIIKEHLISRGYSNAFEVEAIKKDGTIFPVSARVWLFKEKAGNPTGIWAIVRDITERRQAENALKESEEKYSMLVEKGNDGIIITQDGVLKFANSKLCEITGFSLREAIGRSFIDFVAPEYRQIAIERYTKRIFREKVSNRYEIEILTKDCRKIPIEVNANMIEYEGKSANMAIIRDITQRKKLETQLKDYTENLEQIVEEKILDLRESEELYRGLYESSIDGIVSVDIEGKILDCNQSFADMLGYTKDELYQLYYQDLTSIELDDVEVQIFSEQVLRIGYSDEYEKEYLKKDGTIVPVSVRVWLIKDKDGTPTGAWSLVRDITEQKKLEKQLKTYIKNLERSETRYRELYESSMDGIVFVDLKDNILECNQSFADMLGYTKDELHQLTYQELIPGKRHDKLDKVIAEQLLSRGYSDEIEKEYLKKDGTIIHGSERIWLIKDREGNPIGRWALTRDITEQKQLESQLKISKISWNDDKGFDGSPRIY